MTRPALRATYRLQMNAGFTLAQARAQVPYLADLGVSHLYLSPVFAARRGSTHGYDVVDPSRINPELGSEADLRALADDLHSQDMGIVLDIVPNHMGVGPENRYWDDVLAHGQSSRFAKWFDIDWTRHKVVLPVLGDRLERVLERGELRVRLVEGETPRVGYFAQSFPLDPASLPPELQLAQVDPEEAGALVGMYARPEGRESLRQLLEAQHYRLVFWRDGATEINYRRFFDVNDLVALRMEDPSVFDETHALVLRLVQDGVIDALRIDHVDGLADPSAYLDRLRGRIGNELPIFVEKILSEGERLPESWPVQGTTGYEFLTAMDDVFVSPDGYDAIERSYRRTRRLGSDATFAELARLSQMKILGGPLRADVNRLAALLDPLARAAGHRWPQPELANALVYLLAALPVYRTYVTAGTSPSDADRDVLARASESAVTHGAAPELVRFIVALLVDGAAVLAASPAARLRFVQRFQQLSGPATAKGVEDTALYAYVPLASRNEVGGAPDRPLRNAVGMLHDDNSYRARHWPLSLLATNTHDTKRSADVRARLAALSEIPEEWDRSLRRWRRLNDKHRGTVRGRMAPDRNGEYLVYQTLVALWPAPRAGRRTDDIPDRAWRDSARDRLTQYMLKAAREAKHRTSWLEPDDDYERALSHFIERILQTDDDAPFLTDVARLVSRVAMLGAYNALARIAVHLTAPGTPDLYQGDELWNYTLVDPDNRRQVDYQARAAALASLPQTGRRRGELANADLFDSRVKLLVTQRLLELRRRNTALFATGVYVPLRAVGPRADHVVSFARILGDGASITVAPRLVSGLPGGAPAEWWGDTAIVLPDELQRGTWSAQVLDDRFEPRDGRLQISELLHKLPVTVLTR